MLRGSKLGLIIAMMGDVLCVSLPAVCILKVIRVERVWERGEVEGEGCLRLFSCVRDRFGLPHLFADAILIGNRTLAS